MKLDRVPVYDEKLSYGMLGWLQRVYEKITEMNGIVTVTSAYTVPENVFYVRADATGGAFAVTIPVALLRDGRRILVKKIDASGNAVTVTRSGTDTFEGSNTISLAAQWAKTLIISNGNNGWEKIV